MGGTLPEDLGRQDRKEVRQMVPQEFTQHRIRIAGNEDELQWQCHFPETDAIRNSNCNFDPLK